MARRNIQERNIKDIQVHRGVFEWLFQHKKNLGFVLSIDTCFAILWQKMKKLLAFY